MSTELSEKIAEIEALLSAGDEQSARRAIEQVTLRNAEDAAAWLTAIERFCHLPAVSAHGDGILLTCAEKFWRRAPADDLEAAAEENFLSSADIDRLAALYQQAGPQALWRQALLQALAVEHSPWALRKFAQLVAVDPPADPRAVDQAFVPLFQQAGPQTAEVFPRLLDALVHPHVAALVLDLANYLCRRQLIAEHPARRDLDRLLVLMGEMAGRLQRLEERPGEFGRQPDEVRKIVSESTPLLIGLCDAAGWIADERAIPKLNQVLRLGHRRLRTEAAAALARLHDEQGKATLLAMSAEPLTRNLALAYLRELGCEEEAPAEQRSPAAQAESELAAWLAEPAQFGLAPQSLLLVDATRMFWPGYNEPIDCFLFDYEYRWRTGELSGVGLVGPVTHSFLADLSDLPPADIYAAYAGWHAEHDAIVETLAEELSPAELAEFQSHRQRWEQAGFSDARLVKRGDFLGEICWVAHARQGEISGSIVIDARHITWLPAYSSQRPITPDVAYDIYKGRRLLESFNRRGEK